MTTIYLLRHGETAWNADGNRYCGRTDLPLTENGIKQAKEVCKKLANVSFDAVYSSPLRRAADTAKIASNRSEVITDERITELDFGKWEGKTREAFMAENKKLWDNWIADPLNVQAGGTGETAGDAVKRVDDFFTSILKNSHSKTFLVVGHNGINRLYLSYKLGMPLGNYRKFFLENASVTIFTLDNPGSFILEALNR